MKKQRLPFLTQLGNGSFGDSQNTRARTNSEPVEFVNERELLTYKHQLHPSNPNQIEIDAPLEYDFTDLIQAPEPLQKKSSKRITEKRLSKRSSESEDEDQVPWNGGDMQ